MVVIILLIIFGSIRRRKEGKKGRSVTRRPMIHRRPFSGLLSIRFVVLDDIIVDPITRHLFPPSITTGRPWRVKRREMKMKEILRIQSRLLSDSFFFFFFNSKSNKPKKERGIKINQKVKKTQLKHLDFDQILPTDDVNGELLFNVPNESAFCF